MNNRKMGKVSVIVCVYNRAGFIERCLNSILSQDFKDYEVIVIDDGSTDGTSQILEEFEKGKKIKVYHNEKNLGLMKSRNIGAEKTISEIVAYTDSDCMVEKEWLEELVKPFKLDQDIVIAGGGILDGPTESYWGLVYKGIYSISQESQYVKKVIGTNMAVKDRFF